MLSGTERADDELSSSSAASKMEKPVRASPRISFRFSERRRSRNPDSAEKRSLIFDFCGANNNGRQAQLNCRKEKNRWTTHLHRSRGRTGRLFGSLWHAYDDELFKRVPWSFSSGVCVVTTSTPTISLVSGPRCRLRRRTSL